VKRRSALAVLEVVFVAVLVGGFLLFRHHHMRYTIGQDGMAPDLPAGSKFWIRKHPYQRVEDVRRGDVILFRLQRDEGPTDYVWRVLALPGERIAMKEDAVIIDGRPLPRQPDRDEGDARIFHETAGFNTYRIAVNASLAAAGNFPEVTVAPGHLFVLGDNRRNAADSRVMGAVSFGSIVGRVGF
jgi:signal peptidase I